MFPRHSVNTLVTWAVQPEGRAGDGSTGRTEVWFTQKHAEMRPAVQQTLWGGCNEDGGLGMVHS